MNTLKSKFYLWCDVGIIEWIYNARGRLKIHLMNANIINFFYRIVQLIALTFRSKLRYKPNIEEKEENCYSWYLQPISLIASTVCLRKLPISWSGSSRIIWRLLASTKTKTTFDGGILQISSALVTTEWQICNRVNQKIIKISTKQPENV